MSQATLGYFGDMRLKKRKQAAPEACFVGASPLGGGLYPRTKLSGQQAPVWH